MKPIDVLETMWTRDIVDLQWDIIRFRRIKADAITYYYEHYCRESSKNVGGAQFANRTEESKGDVARIVVHNMDALERIDRMVMTMEARRNDAYREAERYKIGLGERLRHAAEQVEDAEFREVDHAPGEHEGAA
jgi:hypothetical protein